LPCEDLAIKAGQTGYMDRGTLADRDIMPAPLRKGKNVADVEGKISLFSLDETSEKTEGAEKWRVLRLAWPQKTPSLPEDDDLYIEESGERCVYKC